jgi:hypothetical protein
MAVPGHAPLSNIAPTAVVPDGYPFIATPARLVAIAIIIMTGRPIGIPSVYLADGLTVRGRPPAHVQVVDVAVNPAVFLTFFRSWLIGSFFVWRRSVGLKLGHDVCLTFSVGRFLVADEVYLIDRYLGAISVACATVLKNRRDCGGNVS